MEDVELQMSVLVATHAGPNGHRGKDATENNLKYSFYWDSMEQDCTHFVYPLGLIPRSDGDQELTLGQTRALQLVRIEKLQECLEQLHKHVSARITKNRMRQIQEHN